MSAWSAMDVWLVWLAFCGIFVNAWLGWRLGKLLARIAWASAEAASITRWVWVTGCTHGWRSGTRWPACYVPAAFIKAWWLSIAEPATLIRLTTGVWRGIGNWVVYPASQSPDSEAGTA